MCSQDAIKHCGAADLTVFNDKSSIVPQATIHCLLRKWNRQHIVRKNTNDKYLYYYF